MSVKVFVVPVLVLALASGLGSCNKVTDTKAEIPVQDSSGARVAGAYVKLYANPVPPLHADFSRLTMEGTTDASGRVTFDYSAFYKQGQAGFAVLDILAQKDSLSGDGIIRIEEEQTNEATVTIGAVN